MCKQVATGWSLTEQKWIQMLTWHLARNVVDLCFPGQPLPVGNVVSMARP